MAQESTPRIVLSPRTRAERARTPSLVDVDLDPAQRAGIGLPPTRALLVLGEAGHGKTTVLLHRVARLWRDARRGARAAVLVPSEGLVRLLSPLLVRLGADVDVLTFDRFAAAQARRAFRRLPPESDETPAGVMRFKRSRALREALGEIASRPPAARRGRALAGREDLLELFGDRILVERAARAAGLPPRVADDVLDRTRVQFEDTTERAFSHVIDRERLVAVDRRPIDEGTATEHASTLDVEDYAVLFEIDRLRAERLGVAPTAPRAFDLLAIDEAQELAPLELTLVGRSLAVGGSLVVSGDADQKTDETSSFVGWDEAMRELGAEDHETVTLQIGYRCPPDVVAVARALRRGERPRASVARYDDEPSLARDVGRAAAALLRRDRRASIAVVCRDPRLGRRLAATLRAEVPARVVLDGRFLPRGPVQVTVTAEVKGLEFDYVVVPDADARTFPDDDAARRAMYVAVTRARHQIVLACASAPTPLVAAEGG